MGIYKYSETERMFLERSIVPFAVYQFVDKRINTLLISNGFMKLFGYTDRESTYKLLDNDMYRNVHTDDVARMADAALKFIKDDIPYNVVFRSTVGGGNKLIHAYGEHVMTDHGERIAVVQYMVEGEYRGDEILQDGDLNKSISAFLSETSYEMKNNYDPLTGLPNMTYFFDLAKASRIEIHKNGGHCSIGFANLNGMKYYNKRYGFAEGDQLIRSFGSLLVKQFGEKNCCRIGQDNFAFFAPSDTVEESIEALFIDVEALCQNDDGKPARNISVRVGIYPDTMGIVETNTACDRARFACNKRRNTTSSGFTYFDESMLSYEMSRQYVLDNFDKALKNHWIQAYFQPIVRTANGRVSDEEALARWVDPVRGTLSPAEFIPILENSKLLYKVDLYMVDEIIKKIKAQKEAGLYVVPNSVNLSRTDFDSCDIVEEIRKRVDDSGISRDLLTIEITESVVGSDFDFIKEQIERFQELGFRVWMDDFGSGYSSLDVLQSIHFDLIKMDMRFMKQFDNGEKSKIIITELVRMAMGLGIETVTEGVETKEQMEFLREVGCTKIQGYYYCKPISFDSIMERYKTGTQIGFENPEESNYYEALGRINLYDLSSVAKDESDSFNNFFNTLPMAVAESDGETMKITRCNQSYRQFMGLMSDYFETNVPVAYADFEGGDGIGFVRAIKKCSEDGQKIFLDEKIGKDSTVHALVRRIAVNPVTGVAACAVIVLAFVKDSGRGVTYADIANSLSADYINLYYVNLEDETFVEYRPDPLNDNLTVERRSNDFFAASRKDALDYLYKDDVQRFVEAFNKENIINSIKEDGSFNITYRLLVGGKPTYVNMKAIQMSNDNSHIIIGVNNVDAQKRQQEAVERMKQERTTYARITALSGNYICIYTVDPETDEYTEYGATRDYEVLGLAKTGQNFFNVAVKESLRVVHPDDQNLFKEILTKENVLREIEKNGVFILNYRMVINGKSQYTNLRIAMIEERDGPQLIVGVSNVDSQVRRDMEFEKNNELISKKSNK